MHYNVRHIKTYCGQFALFILSFKNIMEQNVLLSSQILTNHSSRAKNGTSGQGRSTPYLRPVTIFALFWRRFGVEHVVVYVRVASLFAQAELKQSQ